MNLVLIAIAAVLVAAQFALPRRLAFLPLLLAVCHAQNVTVIQVGVAFSTCKLVILAGILRAACEHRLTWSARQPLDLLVGLWAGWMVLSGFAHTAPDHNPITIRLSSVYDCVGSYLYARSFIGSQEDYWRFTKCLAIIVAVLTLVVLVETVTHQNYYARIAGVYEGVTIRGNRVRARGPFSHAILLGTFAATSMALLVGLWRRHPCYAVVGLAACGLIVVCSASSGPLMTLFCAFVALALWPCRANVIWMRWLAVLGVIALQLVMEAPVWYLIARVDFIGGSTGWHRAQLITAAAAHLSEWWLVGTDYTRNWMAYGVEWSDRHVDITNHYINMGVTGGLPLMLLFIGTLVKAFQIIGRGMRPLRDTGNPDELILWCAGVAMFAHLYYLLLGVLF